MSALLEVRGLSVAYGNVEVVHQAALRLEEGRIVTVIGPNGAGKTTLLAALMGMLPARGSIAYAGKEIMRHEGFFPEKEISAFLEGKGLKPRRQGSE